MSLQSGSEMYGTHIVSQHGTLGPLGLVHMQISDLREPGCSSHLAVTREPHRRCPHHCPARAPKECGSVVSMLCLRAEWQGSLRSISTKFPSQVEGLLHVWDGALQTSPGHRDTGSSPSMLSESYWTSGCGEHLKRLQSFPWAWGRQLRTSLPANELIHSPQQSKYTQNHPTGRITMASEGH